MAAVAGVAEEAGVIGVSSFPVVCSLPTLSASLVMEWLRNILGRLPLCPCTLGARLWWWCVMRVLRPTAWAVSNCPVFEKERR
jgi:hypothetical protein